MKKVFQRINHLLFYLTLWLMLLLFPLGLLEQITGAGFMTRLFASIGLVNGFDFILTLGLSLFVVFAVTVILKAKVFKEKPFV